MTTEQEEELLDAYGDLPFKQRNAFAVETALIFQRANCWTADLQQDYCKPSKEGVKIFRVRLFIREKRDATDRLGVFRERLITDLQAFIAGESDASVRDWDNFIAEIT